MCDKALCGAEAPGRDDPVLNPLDIKDTIDCLQDIEYEKRELSCNFNEPGRQEQKICQADHVNVSRPPKQLPITVWKRLIIPMHVPLCKHLVKA